MDTWSMGAWEDDEEDEDQDEIVSSTQAAKILGISLTTLRKWEKKGRIRPYEESENGRKYYSTNQLEEFANAAIVDAYDF